MVVVWRRVGRFGKSSKCDDDQRRARTRELVTVMSGDADINHNAKLMKMHGKQRRKRPPLSDGRGAAQRIVDAWIRDSIRKLWLAV
jgi:hypothetical protein